jgi:hypothetical protein
VVDSTTALIAWGLVFIVRVGVGVGIGVGVFFTVAVVDWARVRDAPTTADFLRAILLLLRRSASIVCRAGVPGAVVGG